MSVGIIGLGYVGLPLAVAFAEAGDDVVAVDVDARKIEALDRGESYIEDIASRAPRGRARTRIEATTRYGRSPRCDAVLICVPDAADRQPRARPGAAGGGRARRSADRPAARASSSCSSRRPTPARRASAWCRCSRSRACWPARDFNLAFSPERVDPGPHRLHAAQHAEGRRRPHRGVRRPRRASSTGDVCDEIVRVSTPEAAEMTKLLENIFRSVNIALVNEMAMLADRMGIDIWEVVDAAATKPYGFMRFEPGPGMGGHCLPVDPFYLTWRAREFDMSTEFIELAGKVNQQMPYHCVERRSSARSTTPASRSRARGSRSSASATRPGVGDIRESPALKIIGAARRARRRPRLPRPVRAGAARQPACASRGFDEALDGADLALIVTAHPGVDHDADRRARAARRRPARRHPRRRLAADRAAVTGAQLSVGVVGPRLLGPQPRAQLRRAARHASCAGAATAAPRRASASRASSAGRGSPIELDDLLADPDLDAVVLATPVPAHAEQAVRVLEAGKHCFVEKPLAQSVADAERVVDAQRRSGKVLMVGHLLEYHPGVNKLKEIADSGELGDIRYIYCNRLNLGQLRADENALWSLGAHDVSVVLHLAGEEPYELSARGESYMRQGIEDVVFGFLRFPSGLAAHLHLSWLDPHKERRFTVVGSKRMATFDDMEPERKMTIYDKGFDESAAVVRRVRRALGRHLVAACRERRAAAARVRALRRLRAQRPRADLGRRATACASCACSRACRLRSTRAGAAPGGSGRRSAPERAASTTASACAPSSTGLIGIARWVRAASSVAGSSTPSAYSAIAGWRCIGVR